jgi:hypothetical protein
VLTGADRSPSPASGPRWRAGHPCLPGAPTTRSPSRNPAPPPPRITALVPQTSRWYQSSFKDQRWAHDDGRTRSFGTQTEVTIRQLATCEDQLQEAQALQMAKLGKFVLKWKLGKHSHMFRIWKDASGFEQVALSLSRCLCLSLSASLCLSASACLFFSLPLCLASGFEQVALAFSLSLSASLSASLCLTTSLSLPLNLTAPQSYCPPVLLPLGLTAPQSHCPSVSLPLSLTAPQSHCFLAGAIRRMLNRELSMARESLQSTAAEMKHQESALRRGAGQEE